MGLLSPWFLAGLAAIGLPIWLHLLRQFKRTPQPFSSLMFFERRIQSSTRHRRLRYLTLLAMRLALLILLAFAFANPFVNRTSTSLKRRTLAVIAIDHSFSMRYGNHLAEAKAEAHRLVTALPGQSLAQVAAFDSHLEMMNQPDHDKSALNAAIDSIEAGDQASSYGEFSRALRAMEQTTSMQLDAHLITDVQQTSMPASFRDLQAGPHISLAIHAVGTANSANWAIESVTVPARVFAGNHANLTATVAGWQTGPANRKISLLLDDKTLSTRAVAIPDHGRAQVEFDGFDVPYGAHRGELRMEPHDTLANDDSFAFSIERSDARKVLFLYAAGRAHDAFYYQSAMAASSGVGLTVQTSPIEQPVAQDLSKYAFIVLNGLGTLDEAVGRQLGQYVSRGGAALVAVGPSTVRAGKIPLAGNAVVRSGTTQGAGKIDPEAFALIGIGDFQNVEFVNTPRIAAHKDDRVLAQYADGSPLLIEKRCGEGRMLVFASTLDNSTSDFPLHTSYLPFVVQSGAYLSGTEDEVSTVVVGTPVALRQANVHGTAADVIDPDGRHALSLNDATHAMTYDMNRSGFYEVQRANGKRVLLAVHADRRESDLTPVPADTLSLWRNTGKSDTQPAGGTQKQTAPWSLWRYVLTMVLIAAVVESIFAGRYLGEERQNS